MSNCNRKSSRAQAVEEAMDQHDGLVHAFIQRQGGGEISYEEALQAGRIGLWHAVERYDPRRGAAFSTYAWVAICNQIRHRARELKRERGISLGEIPATWHVPEPEAQVEHELMRETLLDLVGQLPERLQQVIIGRYGLGEDLPCTLKQIGEELGVCKERVRQLQQEALAWLRHPAHSWQLRQLVAKNTAAEYRQVLAQNATMRRSRRRGK